MNISFGSTYKIQSTAKQNSDTNFVDKLYELYEDGVECIEDFTPYEEAIKTGVFSKITLVAPDKFDKKVESILCSFGIDFHKTTKKENLDLNNIKARMRVEPDFQNTHTLVEVNAKKLNELLKLDGISSIEEDDEDTRFKRFHEYLETGLEIDAPVVVFSQNGEEATGIHIQDGRHRFAILRDMGMEKIPVAVSKNSIKNLKKFNLI